VPALQTSQGVVDRSKAFAEACGKEVTLSADTPGFLANRILMPYINEAIICLETGVGSKEDLDKTARLGFGHPMGASRRDDLRARFHGS
jgi:3-hydroxybutyryl-CoA dehydrogenase